MAGTWVHEVAYTDGAGTTATAITGGNMTIPSVGGGAAWVGTTPKRGFDINDNLSFKWTGGTTINGWLHGRTSAALGAIVNDARSATKIWTEVCGTGFFGSSAHNSLRLSVTSAGACVWSMNIFPGGIATPLDMVTSSTGVYGANTDGYLLGILDAGNATAADRGRLYYWGVRLIPATYNDPGSGYTLTFAHASGARVANGGDGSDGQTINGAIYWHEIATDIPDDAEIEDRADQLALDNDAQPTTGGGGTETPVNASAGVTATPSLLRSVGLIRADGVSVASSLLRSVGLIRADGVSTSSTLVRSVAMARAASATAGAAVSRSVGMARAAGSSVIAACRRTVGLVRGSSSSTSAAAFRSVGLPRSAGVNTSAARTRSVGLLRGAGVTAGAAVTRACSMSRSAGTSCTAAVARGFACTRNASVSTSASALLGALVTWAASAGVATTATAGRTVGLVRAAAVSAAATLRRTIALGFSRLVSLISTASTGGTPPPVPAPEATVTAHFREQVPHVRAMFTQTPHLTARFRA
jgi:hypothetical protein